MSVQNQTVKNVYAGNGSTTVFPFTFALLETDGEYVKVYVTNDAGTSEETNNFTIDTQAKTVTYPTAGDPLPVGKKIVIRRAIPNEQELNLENLGPFFAEDVEGEFDRTVMMIQQLQEEADRSIKVDQASDTPPEELVADLFEAAADAVASATAAHNSELAAAASETAAGNSATAAGNSATAAYNSEVAAGSSATAAGNSATAAYNSQVAAASSETNAGASATAANNSKIAAASSETNAGNSATAAGNSATAAHNSEVAAAGSANAAAQSAAEAEGINYLVRKNSTAYAVGVVAFYKTIPSPLVLECTTAGTTAAVAPDFSGAVEGGTVTDGTVVWTYKNILTDISACLTREITPAVNHRDVITTSGTYTAPVTGWYHITCIGGGGAGGNGGYAYSNGGLSGTQGGTSSFGLVCSAAGGHSGAGGSGGGEGGGGAAGEIAHAYTQLTAGDTVTVVVGAGGVAPTSGYSPNTTGANGSGGAVGGSSNLGGEGAASIWGSGRNGVSYNNPVSSQAGSLYPRARGGSNGTCYGGGGAGSVCNYATVIGVGSIGGDSEISESNGERGAIITQMSVTYPKGGDGGNGAVIIEYFA